MAVNLDFQIPDPKQFENCKLVYVYDPDKTSRKDREKREILIRAIISSLPKLVIRVANEYSFPDEWKYQPLLELNPKADIYSQKDINNRMHKRDHLNSLHGVKYFSDNYHFKDEVENGEIKSKDTVSHRYGSDLEKIMVYIDTRKDGLPPKLFNDNKLLDELLKRPFHFFAVCTGKEAPDLYLNDCCLMLFESFHDYNHHLLITRKTYDPQTTIYTDDEIKEKSKGFISDTMDHFNHLEILRKQPENGFIYIDKVSNINSDCKWDMKIINF